MQIGCSGGYKVPDDRPARGLEMQTGAWGCENGRFFHSKRLQNDVLL